MSRESTGSGDPLVDWPVDKTIDDGSTLTDKLNEFRDAAYTLHSNGTSTRPGYLDSKIGLWLDNTTAASWKLNISDGTGDNIELFEINSTANTVTPPTYSSLLVEDGGGSGATANSNRDNIVVDSSTAAGISVLGGDSSSQAFVLGSTSDNVGAQFTWAHNSDLGTISTNKTGASFYIGSGQGANAIFLDDSQRVGIGTVPDTNSRLHVVNASSGATADSTARNFIFENNGTTGMSVLGPNSARQTLALGSPTAPLGTSLTWQHSLLLGEIGTEFATANFRINYSNGVLGAYFDAANDYLGLFNGSPEGPLHFGDAIPSNWSIGGASTYGIFKTTGTTNWNLSCSSDPAVQIINTSLGADHQMIQMRYNDNSIFHIKSIGDDTTGIVAKHIALEFNGDTGAVFLANAGGSSNVRGSVYMPDIGSVTPSTEKALYINTSTGRVYYEA
jgi:hypothetical protein